MEARTPGGASSGRASGLDVCPSIGWSLWLGVLSRLAPLLEPLCQPTTTLLPHHASPEHLVSQFIYVQEEEYIVKGL